MAEEAAGRVFGDLRARLGDAIRAYDGQGWHRTGTPVDTASASWLAGEVRRRGVEPELHGFTLDRLDPGRVEVAIGGETVAGEMLYDAAPTGPEGVVGRLGALGDGAEIGLAVVPPYGPAPLDEARRAGRHRAFVAVTEGHVAGLSVRNAPDFDAPFGPPVVQVGSDRLGWLEDAAQVGTEVRVLATATRTRAEARNVLARVPGRRPDLRPVVVLTPRSGWWCCAAERGGGLAVWLEILHHLNAAPPARDVWFVATSGHELGHLGLRAVERDRPALFRDAEAWVHLGASIGAARDPRLHLGTATPELRDLAARCMAEAGATGFAWVPQGAKPRGEAQNVAAAGGRYVSLAGQHALFHHPDDRWPDAVDLESLAAYARAICAVVDALAGEEARSG